MKFVWQETSMAFCLISFDWMFLKSYPSTLSAPVPPLFLLNLLSFTKAENELFLCVTLENLVQKLSIAALIAVWICFIRKLRNSQSFQLCSLRLQVDLTPGDVKVSPQVLFRSAFSVARFQWHPCSNVFQRVVGVLSPASSNFTGVSMLCDVVALRCNVEGELRSTMKDMKIVYP